MILFSFIQSPMLSKGMVVTRLHSYLAAATFNETSIIISSVPSLFVFGAVNTTFDCTVRTSGAGTGGPAFYIINSTVSFSGLSFQNCSNAASAGGAIAANSSNLALVSCSFKNNSASTGGAVSAVGGALLVNGSLFVGNSASCFAAVCFTWGGAISTLETLVVTVVSCVFSFNTVNMPFVLPPPGSIGSIAVGGGGGISVSFNGNVSNSQVSFINNSFYHCTVTAAPYKSFFPLQIPLLYGPISWISGGAVSVQYGSRTTAGALLVSNVSSTFDSNTCSNCAVSTSAISVGGGDGGCFSLRVGAFSVNAGNSTVFATNLRFFFTNNSVIDCFVRAGDSGSLFAACLGGGISVIVGSSAYALSNGSTSLAQGDTRVSNSNLSFSENTFLSCSCFVNAHQSSFRDTTQPTTVQHAFGGGLSVFLGASTVLAYEMLTSLVYDPKLGGVVTRATSSVGSTFVDTAIVNVSNNILRRCSSIAGGDGVDPGPQSQLLRGGGSSIMIGGFSSLSGLTHENPQFYVSDPRNPNDPFYNPLNYVYIFGVVSAGAAVVSRSSILANSNTISFCQVSSYFRNPDPSAAFWSLSSGGGFSLHIGSSVYYTASDVASNPRPTVSVFVSTCGQAGDSNVSDSFVNVSGNRISSSNATSWSLLQTTSYCSSSSGGGVDISVAALVLCSPSCSAFDLFPQGLLSVLRSNMVFASNIFSQCAVSVRGSDLGSNIYGARSFGGGLGIAFGGFVCNINGDLGKKSVGSSSFVDIIVNARFNSFSTCSATSSLPSDGLAFGLIAMGGGIGLSFGAYLLSTRTLAGGAFVYGSIDVMHLSYVTVELSANRFDSCVAACIVTGGGQSHDLQANGGAAALVFGAQCHAYNNADSIELDKGKLGVQSGTLCSVNSITASSISILMHNNTVLSCSAQSIFTSNVSVLVQSRGSVASGGGVAVLMRGFSYSKGLLSGGPSISFVALSSLSSVVISAENNSFQNCFVSRSATLSLDAEVGCPACFCNLHCSKPAKSV
jgi:hypothetical protein